mgnify:CR=1 FL=1|jgi:hypothetical protein
MEMIKVPKQEMTIEEFCEFVIAGMTTVPVGDDDQRIQLRERISRLRFHETDKGWFYYERT